ncbi:undecaprenyl/decaprenyl-phosphate alpha-N-acetylglucosaminyl 1-phosphate transferase [bacterium SCSIO 12741]|nr:undecaprenyl/decaprenyl-phosphate alpha-N-acetylglucosaminyl 1-phosphate transferase [bacterium SCSIO 12741]
MDRLLVYKYVGLFVFSLVLALILNTIFLRFSRNLGNRNIDEGLIRWSSVSKPSLGGISFYIIFLVTYSIYTIFFNPGTHLLNPQHIGILLATGMAFLMGLSDDAYNTNPLLKFLVQVACGGVLILTGTYISLFELELFNYLLTIFWVVAVMNSINMLDNMDAITTMVSIFIIFSAMSSAWISPDFNHFCMTSMVGLSGALIGFLFYNWNPSKMFMGDTGSQFLGIFLAAFGIIYFWNNKAGGGEEAVTRQVTITMIAFIVPITDTLTVIINRLRRKQSPFVGGKDHTTHHLSYLGLNDRNVARVFALISFVSYILVYLIVNNFQEWTYLKAILFLSYFLIVFGTLYTITQLPKTRKKFKEQNGQ